jgi:Flp pilus assembly pilin Flp
MWRLFRNRKAQSTAEYAVLIALVVAAVVGMQTYVKRGVQARVKDASDDFTANISSATTWSDWAGMPVKAATLSGTRGQYEHSRLSSKNTQNVLQDDQTTSMASNGALTSRATTQQTKQETGDYRKFDYSAGATE